MGALISECGQYRYWLDRDLGVLQATRGPVLFAMLNPSTADAEQDDPTIRRCKAFAKAWGCPGLTVANLYALRATNPADLWRHPDPVGAKNDIWLQNVAREFGDVVCAWGVNAKPERVEQVRKILTDAGARLWCLGATKDGHPRHPLYVKGDQPLVRWPVVETANPID